MAFEVIDKQPGGGTGKISIGQSGEATEIWTVIADGYDYSTEDLRTSSIFPPVYESFHAQNSRLRLMPIDVQQDSENPALFICTLTWTSDKLDPKEIEEQEDNPLDRVARISVKTGKMKETKHRDFYGKLKVNTAGDLFDPPIENNCSFKIIVIRKNVTVFPDWVFDFDDAVNSVPFTIKGRLIDKGCAWIADISLGDINTDGPTPYCEAMIEIHVRKRRKPTAKEIDDNVTPPDPWQTEQLNEGINQIIEDPDNPGDYIKIRTTVKDDAGVETPSSGPVPLDSEGVQLSTLTPETIDDDAVFVVFRDQEELDFNLISYLWSDA